MDWCFILSNVHFEFIWNVRDEKLVVYDSDGEIEDDIFLHQ